METACKKTNTCRTETNYLYLLLFKNFFISPSSASHDIFETRVLEKNAIPLRIYLLFLTFSLKKKTVLIYTTVSTTFRDFNEKVRLNKIKFTQSFT